MWRDEQRKWRTKRNSNNKTRPKEEKRKKNNKERRRSSSKKFGQSLAAVSAASPHSCPPFPRPSAALHLSVFVCHLHPPSAASGAVALGADPAEPAPTPLPFPAPWPATALRERTARSTGLNPLLSPQTPAGAFLPLLPFVLPVWSPERGLPPLWPCPLPAAGTGGEIQKQTSGRPRDRPSQPAAEQGGCQPGLFGGSVPPGWPCAVSPGRSFRDGKATEVLPP